MHYLPADNYEQITSEPSSAHARRKGKSINTGLYGTVETSTYLNRRETRYRGEGRESACVG